MENTLQEEQEEMWGEEWREGMSVGVKRRHTSGGERSQVATTRKRSGGVWEKSFEEMEEKMEVEGEKRMQQQQKVEVKEGDDNGWQVQTKRKKRKKNKESHEEGKQDNKDDKKKDINFGILRARLRRKRKEEKNEEKRITLMMVEEERRLADQVGVEEGSSRGAMTMVEEVTMMPPVHELVQFNRGSSQSQSQEDDEGQSASVRTNWMLQSTKVSLSQEIIKKPQGSNKGHDCDKGQCPSQGHGFLDTDSLDYADAVEVRILEDDLFLLQNSYCDG